MATLLQRLEIVKDFAQTAVETTISTVQTVHTTIADTSYNVMSQSPIGDRKLQQMKEKHDATSAEGYDAIRSVNQSLGALASDYFESVEDSAHASDVMTKNNEKKSD